MFGVLGIRVAAWIRKKSFGFGDGGWMGWSGQWKVGADGWLGSRVVFYWEENTP